MSDREINEEIITAIAKEMVVMIKAAIDGGAITSEVVYGVHTGLLAALDDGSQSFADFVSGALAECQASADMAMTQYGGVH